MSGFRKAHGCQDVLLNFTKNAKLSLDNRNVTLALLTDLSKALIVYLISFYYRSCMPM